MANKYGLTRKELEIIKLIGREGIFRRKELAEKLVVAECTISTHLMSIYSKTGLKNIAGIVKFYYEKARVK